MNKMTDEVKNYELNQSVQKIYSKMFSEDITSLLNDYYEKTKNDEIPYDSIFPHPLLHEISHQAGLNLIIYDDKKDLPENKKRWNILNKNFITLWSHPMYKNFIDNPKYTDKYWNRKKGGYQTALDRLKTEIPYWNNKEMIGWCENNIKGF